MISAVRCSRPCPRLLSQRHYSQLTDAPAGLRYTRHFLESKAYHRIVEASFRLHETLHQEAEGKKKITARSYLSRQHNLQSDEFYKVLKLGSIDCQHFEKYGDDGHTLTYFIGNQNVPPYFEEVKSRINSLHEVQKLSLEGSRKLDWKVTFKTYRSINAVRAGFPFHIDTPTNGEITAIFTLLAEAELQMKQASDPDPTFSVQLIPNSLLLLSGPARWNWQHRVLPKSQIADTKISRMSLVFGCQTEAITSSAKH